VLCTNATTLSRFSLGTLKASIVALTWPMNADHRAR
jgi:hypothetical protein